MKTKKLNNYPFDGWDYTELAEAWNIYIPDNFWVPGIDKNRPEEEQYYHDTCSDTDPIKWVIEGALSKFMGNKSTHTMKKMASDLRIYLDKLGHEDNLSCQAPMWKGMSKIDCDWTILSIAITLLPQMWD